jgi:hypothetical protein
MTKKLPDTEVRDRVKVHLAGYDLARWRQSMKFYGPENAALRARALAGRHPAGPQIVECLRRGDQRGAGEAAMRRWTTNREIAKRARAPPLLTFPA